MEGGDISMSSIDQRVVEMKFQNSQFQSGAADTLSTLDKLKRALQFDGATKGFNDINGAAKKINLTSIGQSVDAIKEKFNALSVAGIAALGSLASKAVDFGINRLGKMFEPAMDGFREYELKMNSIQTIMANTSRHGTSLETVNAELDKLNEYADLTIYNFAEMTRNASLFTASGMKIEDATAMIKGFSNEAAASGTNSSDAARAAYQLTQAMNNGVVKLQDWKSITNAGMGTANMRDGLVAVAESLGTFNSSTTTAEAASANFNASLEKGWLTADVMSQYLQIMTGDMTEAEIAAMGFSKETAKMMYEQGQMGLEAATKVRTLSQLIGAAQEGVGSGWARTMELLIGDFKQASELFSSVWKVLDEMIGRQADSRNNLIESWVKLGGRDDIIQGFVNLWQALLAVIEPVQKAFREIFPPKTGQDLKRISQGFEDFTEKVKMAAEFIGKGIGPPMKVFFSVLKAGLTILKGIAVGIVAVAGFIGSLVISLVRLATTLGNAGLGFIKMIAGSEKIQSVFQSLKSIFDNIVGAVKEFIAVIVDVAILVEAAFVNFRSGPEWAQMGILLLAAAFERLGFSTETAYRYAYNLWKFFSNLSGSIKNFANNLSLDPLINGLKSVSSYFDDLKNKLKGSGKGLNFGKSLDVGNIKLAAIETDKLASSFESLKSKSSGIGTKIGAAFSKIGDVLGRAFAKVDPVIDRVFAKIGGYLDTLTFQELLALINTGFFMLLYKNISGLSSAFKDVGEVIGGLGEALENFGKETVADKIMKIAVALAILAAAAYVLSGIDTESLTKALVAIAVMMAQLTATLAVMSKIEFGKDAKMMKIGTMLALMAVGILVLAHAVRQFEGLSWEDMAKGLIAVSALLAGLALFTKFAEVEKGSIKSMVGLIAMTGAILLLSVAVEKLGTMDIKTLQQGLLTIGLILVAFASMTIIMDQTDGVLKASVAMLVLSAALAALYLVLVLYNTLEWETLAQGLLRIAAALVVISLALQLLPMDLLSDAAGLLIVAAALNVLMGVMAVAALMSWEDIAKGLVTIGGALMVMAVALNLMNGTIAGSAALVVATLALALLVPVLISLGMLPWEVLLKGLVGLAGIFAVLALAGYLMAPVVPIIALLAAAILALGVAMALAGAAMIAFGFGFGLLAAAIVSGGAAMMLFFQQLVMMIPLFAQQLALGIIAFAVVIRDAGPPIVDAVTTVLISILKAIQKATPEAAKTLAVMIMAMVDTVRTLVPLITQRVLAMVLEFLQILRQYAPPIVAEVMGLMVDMLQTARQYVPQIVDEALKLMTEFLAAVADNIGPIVDEATRLMVEFMDGIERNIPDLVDSGARMVKTFIREVGIELAGGVSDMISAAKELAGGIISGMVSGISGGLDTIKSAAVGVARDALAAAKNWLGIKSPSRKFRDEVGKPSAEGMAVGMLEYGGKVTDAAETVGKEAIFAMKKAIDILPSLFEDDPNFSPVITPVLDLTQIDKGSNAIGTKLSAAEIKLNKTYSRAASVERARASIVVSGSKDDFRETMPVQGPTFIQNNTSPKALSSAEIYRQTKNQLSLIKKG